MRNKINNFLNIVMGTTLGVFVGTFLFRYFDYRKYPDLYESYSAPWYTSILVAGSVALVVLAVCMIGKWILHKVPEK